ncbi:hypothetical protein MUK42_27097 [Musa troglodytarum]|uniref:Uncharacterized protein n=1 Tax=Musa troglodytarum TaxID=320322 RepID=A0A9E7JXS8_9LILI|nr:hypothetical protein MUK42_27097 [Musa troglodytarum]
MTTDPPNRRRHLSSEQRLPLALNKSVHNGGTSNPRKSRMIRGIEIELDKVGSDSDPGSDNFVGIEPGPGLQIALDVLDSDAKYQRLTFGLAKPPVPCMTSIPFEETPTDKTCVVDLLFKAIIAVQGLLIHQLHLRSNQQYDDISLPT